MRGLPRFGFRRCRNAIALAMASRPRGMLIQKAQRQPMPSVNQPPSRGPATEASANTPPIAPMYRPRCLAGTTSAMIAWDSRINPPPPSPCTARPAMSVVMSWDRPPITEPTMKMLMAPMKRPLRPIRSPSFPYTGIMTVEARMYAVVTQTMCVDAVQFAHDGGQRGTEDHLVERSQKHRDHQPDKNEDDRPFCPARPRCRYACRRARRSQLLEWTCSSLVE